ncbi:MAG: response regulator [Woeseia sp.]
MTAMERANVLLVDDKPERLLTYEVILQNLEQNLVLAHSGEEALEKLEMLRFAAILLDVSMPGLDGFETAALVRQHPGHGQTPIIFVTGVHITDFDRLKGYEMGAADYVYVPVVPEILRSKVQVLVQLDLQRRQLARLNDRLAETNTELAEAHARLQAENTRELQKLNRTLAKANAQLISEIGERKRAEAMLKEDARRKDEFISILGHELRNPLAAMQSGVELLGGSTPLDGKLSWARDLLQRQLLHLTRLIDDLLDVSRISSGRVKLQRETLTFQTVIDHSVDAVRPLVNECQHTLHIDMPSEPVCIDGDSVRLTQLFGNLLTNAAKYTDEGGTIVLSAVVDESDPDRWLTVRVKDTGAGIPKDMLERVFELFTQANTGFARTQSGLGIGLGLVRALAELHGGSVHAESDGPGCGSEFVVKLPLVDSAASSPPGPERKPAAALIEGSRKRLLIIDDNTDSAHGLAIYLSGSAGHEVRLAHTGESGIDEAVRFRPDAVLLDIGLPDIEGFEVAKRLRSHPGLERLVLIAISGYSSDGDRKRAEETGFDHYLVKPVSLDLLNQVLKEALSTGEVVRPRELASAGCRHAGD